MGLDRAGKAIILVLFLFILPIFLTVLFMPKFILVIGITMELILIILLKKKTLDYSLGEVGLSSDIDFKKHILIPLVFSVGIYILVLASAGFKIKITYNPTEYLILMIYYTLYVGVFEELLFRGLFFSALEEKYGAWAIVISALVFASIHIDNIVFPLIWGLIAGAYRYKYKNITGLILAHGLIDFLGQTIDSTNINVTFYLLSLSILTALLMYCFLRTREEN